MTTQTYSQLCLAKRVAAACGGSWVRDAGPGLEQRGCGLRGAEGVRCHFTHGSHTRSVGQASPPQGTRVPGGVCTEDSAAPGDPAGPHARRCRSIADSPGQPAPCDGPRLQMPAPSTGLRGSWVCGRSGEGACAPGSGSGCYGFWKESSCAPWPEARCCFEALCGEESFRKEGVCDETCRIVGSWETCVREGWLRAQVCCAPGREAR